MPCKPQDSLTCVRIVDRVHAIPRLSPHHRLPYCIRLGPNTRIGNVIFCVNTRIRPPLSVGKLRGALRLHRRPCTTFGLSELARRFILPPGFKQECDRLLGLLQADLGDTRLSAPLPRAAGGAGCPGLQSGCIEHGKSWPRLPDKRRARCFEWELTQPAQAVSNIALLQQWSDLCGCARTCRHLAPSA